MCAPIILANAGVPMLMLVFHPLRTFLRGNYKIKLAANSCIALSSSRNAVSISSNPGGPGGESQGHFHR
jgi:hypothetical protein